MTKIAYLDKPDFDYRQKGKLEVSCGLSELDEGALKQVGENLACKSLYDRGYEILERNWRTQFGEADIIARDSDTTVLAEVKTRVDKDSDETLIPEIAVDDKKQDIYNKMAMDYLGQHPERDRMRIDVVEVVLTSTGAHVHHFLGHEKMKPAISAAEVSQAASEALKQMTNHQPQKKSPHVNL